MVLRLGPNPPIDNVADLKKDPLVMWQHRHIHLLAVLVSFGLPTLLGWLWDGWIGALGGFLIGGGAKDVVVSHRTFFFNSACPTLRRPPHFPPRRARGPLFFGAFSFCGGD